MFDEPLPKQADLRKLASRQAHFSVHLDAAQLPRFAGAIVDGQGVVDAELQLGVNEQYVRYLQGTVSCTTQVVCQRCMEPMPITIHSDVLLGIVWDEAEARNLPKAMDPLIVAEDELVDLNEVVEDELLLAMPFASYHDPDQCGGKQVYQSGEEQAPASAKKENPFSVLAQLKPGK